MRVILFVPLFCSLLAACDRHAVPPEQRHDLAIVEVVPAAAGAAVDDELLECGIVGELISELEDEVDRRFNVRRVRRASGTPGNVLAMRFVLAEGAGGGMLSGPKRLALAGSYFQDGELMGSFVARRTGSNGFSMGYYKGTCSMVEELAEELAEDIAEWLLEPRMHAQLGERG